MIRHLQLYLDPCRLLVLCIVLAAGGCQQMQVREQEVKLDDSVKFYVRAIRWGEYAAAAALIKPRTGEVPAYDAQQLKGLKVTTYEFAIQDRPEGDKEARMSVDFTYYFEDSGRVRSVSNQGVWWYDEAQMRWYLDGKMPDFRR